MSDVEIGRDTQRAAVLAAAAAIVEAGGFRALTARRLAEAAGCAVGTLYNLFANTDAILLALMAETLRALDGAMAGACAAPQSSAEATILRMARCYLDFTLANRPRWSLVLDAAIPGRHPEIDAEVDRLVGRLVAQLAALVPDLAPRRLAAAALWSGLEGTAALALSGNARRITDAEPWPMVEFFVATFLGGLRAARLMAGQDDAASPAR